MLCERSLTNAYCTNNALVTKKIVLQSAQEALGDEYQAQYWWQHIAVKSLAASVVLGVIVSSSYFFGQLYGVNIVEKSVVHVPEIPANKIVTESASPVIVALADTENNITEKNKPAADEGSLVASIDNSTKEFEIKSKSDQKQAGEFIVDKKVKAENNTGLEQNNLENESVIADNRSIGKFPENLSVNAVDGVSEDLLARFQSAIDETQQESSSDNSKEPIEREEVDVPALSDMPTWVQNDLPSISFEQHIYTSDGESWVKVNGRDRYEGDTIANGLVLSHIYAQKVILTFKGEQFSLPALSTW